MKKYLHSVIEKFVQKFWKNKNTFKSNIDFNKEKYYCLSMFPYPSGFLHMGHIRNYTIGDIFARFQRMNGKNVMYPIGWDAFGLPAENAAILNNINPKEWTFNNINYMRKQLKSLGFSFDWSKEIITCKKNYYKWDQIFFKKLFDNKMIYKKYYLINWCDNDNTVLANEQVINNKCWRCNNNVKIKYINQWFLKISLYSNRLINDIKYLKYWPKEVKLMQYKWIGKSTWIKIKFTTVNLDNNICINVYFKNVYEILNLSNIIISLKFFKKKFLNYIHKFNLIYKNIKKSNYIETNIILLSNLFNKFFKLFLLSNDYFLYIYINKYIKNYNINLFKSIIDYKKYKKLNIIKLFLLYIYDFLFNIISISNCNKYNNNCILLNNKIFKIIKIYKLKDWCISRQRYWGVPIPIIKNIKSNKLTTISDKYIPLKLGKFNDYYKCNLNNKILINKNIFSFEKDTLDTFIQSSWYYLRYTSPNYNKFMFNKKYVDYWLPIDQYIGGIEHSNMHLIYIRYYHKLMKKFYGIKNNEPIIKLLCQGMVLNHTYYYLDSNNKKIWINYKNINNNIYKNKNIFYYGLKKMSKSKNNGVNPLDIIKKYGSDTLRIFIIFSAPIKSNLIWNEKNIIGIYRFLNKLWNLINFHINNKYNILKENKNIKYDKICKFVNKIIYNINYDINIRQSLNISISNIMKLNNEIFLFIKNNKNYNYYLINKILSILIRILYPFAPHISFYLWNKIGFSNIDYSKWPNFLKENFINNNIIYMILINNKFFIKYKFKKNNKNSIIKIIKNLDIIKRKINLNNIKRIIFIKNKLINIITFN